MSKSTVDAIIAKIKEQGLTRGVSSTRETLGSPRQKEVFRAAANTFPRPFLITSKTPKIWKKAADELMKAGSLSCVVLTEGVAYKLTPAGKRRAISEKMLEDDDDS